MGQNDPNSLDAPTAAKKKEAIQDQQAISIFHSCSYFVFCICGERIHVYYKITNKFAMYSRQPDIGLRQYDCTGPGQVVGPTWRKI